MTAINAINADIGYASAGDLLERYRTGQQSPVEVTAAVLERIKAIDPSINAFSILTERQALASAEQSLARWRKGEALPLDGVPVTIKDAYDVEGLETATCSNAVKGKIASLDNPAVERLRKAGAVILGKTTMSEFGWSGMSRNPVTGVTHNPWRRGYNAGASSAGAGAGAAAGFGPLHLGSDGAGSIRMPAHFCGIFGLKPTYGRVPHVPVSNNDYSTYIGPMTRTVEDSARMLEIMAGPHHLDHTSCEAAPVPYLSQLSRSMKGRRVAFSPDLGHARVDPEIATVIANAVKLLDQDIKVNVEEVVPSWGPVGPDLGRFFLSVLWGRRANLLPEFEDRMGSDLVACIRAGVGYSATDYLNQREQKFAYIAAISSFLEEWDYLVTPVASVAAFPVERVRPAHWPEHAWDWLAWSEFLYPFNMSGHPAASVPCGFTPDGLPVGLQIVGKRFDDLGVLQLAHSFQQAMPLYANRPEIEIAG